MLQISIGSLGLWVPIAFFGYGSARNFVKYALCDATKLKNACLSVVRSQTDYVVLSHTRGIVKQVSGNLSITSSSSHFFNKTDFEQYLFDAIIKKRMNKSLEMLYDKFL